MAKKILSPENCNFVSTGADFVQFKSFNEAMDFHKFCEENKIFTTSRIGVRFPAQDMYVISFNLINVTIEPYCILGHSEPDGFIITYKEDK